MFNKVEHLWSTTRALTGSAIVFISVLLGASSFAEEVGGEATVQTTNADPSAGDTASVPAPTPTSEPAPKEASTVESATPTAAETSTAESKEQEAATEEKKPIGINVDVGLASIYNFRGANVFMEKTLQDQNLAFSPSLTWSIFNTGLYLSYWGAYQVTGGNKSYLVDYGLGHEQDLILGYSKGFADDVVKLNLAFTYYFYPFADEDVAGTKNPSAIEPMAGISIATVLDLGFNVSYFHSVQEEISLYRYAYFNFSLGKSFSFNDTFGMSLGMGLGIKAWIENDDGAKNDFNRFDLHFDWGLPINLTDRLYLKPAIHFSWTDLKTVAMEDDPATAAVESTRDAKAGDEYMVYGSINIGANF
jgi:hypothetical protein